MNDLQIAVHECTKCPLYTMRILAVPGEVGPEYNGLGVICEAPGKDEDETGRPLQGRAGKLFDSLLTAADIRRDSLYISNRVRCRPPRNQLDKYPEALNNCDEWTQKELDRYNPSVVLLMGATAGKLVFGQDFKVTKQRGIPRSTGEGFDYGARVWVPTFHPAAVLRNDAGLRPLVMADMRLAKELHSEQVSNSVL